LRINHMGCLCCCLWLGGYVASLTAQTVPLPALQPTKILSYYIRFDASPRKKDIEVPGMQGSQSALVFLSESEVSYQVPAGKAGFSGILVYPPQPRGIVGGGTYLVPMVLQILADGKALWEQVMDGTTPPVQFTLPLHGASLLTVKATAAFNGTVFELVDAAFQTAASDASSNYIVPAGTAFVDAMPQARQAFVHAFYPGEEVPVKIWYGGVGGQSQIQMNLTPQWGDKQPFRITLTVPTREVKQGLAAGTAVWKVPAWLGPARIEITAINDGKSVFHREVDAVVLHPVDVAGIQDNAFGVQVSTEGYPLAYNEFASLWGAKWTRTFAHWAFIEANRGTYDFRRIDPVVDTYRSEGMRFLLELGEDAPAWVGYPGTGTYLEAWKRYVAATVKHMEGRVDTWDVFNEVVNKVKGYAGKASPDWDMSVLKSAADVIHATEPGSTVICCSGGDDPRLAQAGVFSGVDVISVHPYQAFAPEVKDGPWNYLEIMVSLRNMFATYGIHKPIWGTEANWMLGAANNLNVNAPGLSEQKQAEYLARVGMLSVALGVKYFIHSPYYNDSHPQPLLPALAGFAQMTSLFSDISQASFLLSGPNVFGVTAEGRSGRVGGLWSVSGPATVRLEGGENYRFTDMYGNPISANPESVQLSPAPVYFTSSGAAPQVKILAETNVPWKTLPRPGSWGCHTDIGTTCAPAPNGLRVQSDVSKWSLQLVSPTIAVSPNSCITVRVPVLVEKGAIFLSIMDTSTRANVQGRKIRVTAPLPGVSSSVIDLSVRTGSSRSISVAISNGNETPAQSVFLMTAPAQIAPCQE
jgi:hypothetical protein